MKKLSFVIPCYGSELTIEGVIAEIIAVVSQKPEYEYEIICVNDSSPDNVFDILKKLADKNDKIMVIDLARNMGKHSAIMAGFSFITGDYIVNLDDDGQCPLDKLWDLIIPLNYGNDVVMAEYPVKQQSAFKNFGSHINTMMSRWLLGRPKHLYFSNFWIVKRFIAEEIIRYHNPYPYIEGLLLRTTKRIANVKMEERERAAGTGNYTFKKSLSLWLNGFTAFSVKPLRVATIFGFAVSLIGFLFGAYTIINKLINQNSPMGYTSMMAVLLFIGGVIMMILGLIGEYVGRIYISINNSPQYVIREVIKGGKKNESN
jgi:undecaprenyl-phosphate 4-deoxy-4-formamido-L-arabinose transferase